MGICLADSSPSAGQNEAGSGTAAAEPRRVNTEAMGGDGVIHGAGRTQAPSSCGWRLGKRVFLAAFTLSMMAAAGWAQTLEAKGAMTSPPSNTWLALASVTNAPATAKEEPLRLRDDKPLLLLDDEPATNAPSGGADNSRCQVCHINFMQEALSVIHARTNIGCASCHGPCDAHIADESWASGGNGTAPDIMYPRSKIRFKCLGCHDWVKLVASDQQKPKQAERKEKPNHQAVLDGTNREKRFCTDCHGSHRMVTRKCKWKS